MDGDGGRVVEQTQPQRAHPIRQVEVLVEEREALLVKPSGARQEVALDRDVGRVEGAPPGVLAGAERAEVELDAPVQPGPEAAAAQSPGPAHPAQDRHLGRGMAAVPGGVLGQGSPRGDDIVAQEQRHRASGRPPAGVAGGGGARSGGDEVGGRIGPAGDQVCARGRVHIRAVGDRDHLEGDLAALLRQGVEHARQGSRPSTGRDHHAQVHLGAKIPAPGGPALGR